MAIKRLMFSVITLFLRSPFALPSLTLRSPFALSSSCFWQCWLRNNLIVKELRFHNKERSLGGGECIIRNKIPKTLVFLQFFQPLSRIP